MELDYLMYFLDEELLTLEEENDDCGCGCGHYECSHDEECECGDECHCHDDIEF